MNNPVNKSASVTPILIFGYGNPSRGDDALAPLLLERINHGSNVELLTDFQLQIEHSLDMVGRELILFVDASISCSSPFEFIPLEYLNPQATPTYTTHQLTPEELVKTYLDVHQQPAPPAYLLSIRGEQFELGVALSEAAETNIQLAIQWTEQLLQRASSREWQQLSKESAARAA